MTYSFDIFDTCLVRKCGTPENMLDILSLHVFRNNVSESIRQTFVAARGMSEMKLYGNPFARLSDIYYSMDYSQKELKSKEELIIIEQDIERRMLVVVPEMKDLINSLRNEGNSIIFISDMYLSKEYLTSILIEQGLFCRDKDKIFVSCDVGKRKVDGSLYRYVHDQEGLSFKEWVHYGDNIQSDIKQASLLGIGVRLVKWEYTPYEKCWRRMYNPHFRYGDMLAGICRSIRLETIDKGHRDFVLNVGAPLLVLFVYRVMADAHKKGIRELFFCARDAKMLYIVAQQFQCLFPSIGLHYLFISRTALYDGDSRARKTYFEQCGLATRQGEVAIVDLRSSGKTQCVLNKQLVSSGYKAVSGYYYEMFCTGNLDNIPVKYYAEFETPYYSNNGKYSRVFANYPLIEMYFPLHDEARTIDYVIRESKAEPVFANDDVTELAEDYSFFLNKKEHIDEHKQCFVRFSQLLVETGLYKYADELFNRVALITWMSFCEFPNPYYLSALTDFRACKCGTSVYLPYVKKMNYYELLTTRGKKSYFKRGSIIYSLPKPVSRFMYTFRHVQ